MTRAAGSHAMTGVAQSHRRRAGPPQGARPMGKVTAPWAHCGKRRDTGMKVFRLVFGVGVWFGMQVDLHSDKLHCDSSGWVEVGAKQPSPCPKPKKRPSRSS